MDSFFLSTNWFYTALRKIAMMLPWKTVGLHCPSSSSAATCAQKGGRLPKTGCHKTGPDDISFLLVFFSTFEELTLPIKGLMEDAGVVKLYEPSPTPRLLQRTCWVESP